MDSSSKPGEPGAFEQAAEGIAHTVGDFISAPVTKIKGLFAKTDDASNLQNGVVDVRHILQIAKGRRDLLMLQPNERLKSGLQHLDEYCCRVQSFEDKLKNTSVVNSPAEKIDTMRNIWSDELQHMYATGLDEIIMAVEQMRTEPSVGQL